MARGLEVLASLLDAFFDGGDKLERVMLVPPFCCQSMNGARKIVDVPRVRIDLLELDLMLSYRLAIGIKDQES